MNQITPNFSIRTTKVGHKIIGMSQLEVIAIFGGYGICDHCGQPKSYGYLIPVFGRKWNCTQCKIEWEAVAKHYPEDDKNEARVLEEFISIIKAYDARVQMQE